jgi:Ni/Co efflux regulator RcnB
MKKIIFILAYILWVHATAMAQSSEDLSGKNKKNQNYLAKETDKVIEGRSGRRQKNAQTHNKNKQSESATTKKKPKRRSQKIPNFGFY